jgi:hypothetical protein
VWSVATVVVYTAGIDLAWVGGRLRLGTDRGCLDIQGFFWLAVCMEQLDLGVCEAQFFGEDPERVAVLLPGAYYVPAAPLLWFAREALQAHGWSVLQVWDQWDRSLDPTQWVLDRLNAALDHVGKTASRLLVTKSMSSHALPVAVELGLPGIWMTPLLGRESVRNALAAVRTATLAIGGTADQTWDSEFVAALKNVEVLEVPDADHSLQYPGDPTRSIEALQQVTERIGVFAGRLD